MGTATLILHTCYNEYTTEQMLALANLAQEFGAKFRILPTGLQITELAKESKDAFIAKLPEGIVVSKHRSVNSIIHCRGKEACKNGFVETRPLTKYLEDNYYGKDLPHKLRIGISGCPHHCADSLIKDIGVFGLPDGYVITGGGTSGIRPQAGKILKKGLTLEEAQKAIAYLIEWYEREGNPKEHFDHLLNRLGNPLETDAVID